MGTIVKPTPIQIDAEVATLQALRPFIQRGGMFGDNHAQIDAQIEVLTKRMTETQCFDRFAPIEPDDDIDEDMAGDLNHDEKRSNEMLDAALESIRWLAGEDKAPSQDWAEIARPANLIIDVETIAKAIGIPAPKWEGRCHEIAQACYDAGCVPKDSKVLYGVWHGPISDKSSKFAGRTITHHGWIELPNGEVYDPTRWAFEGCPPYVWVGRDVHLWYDFGGNELRESLMDCTTPPPEQGNVILLDTACRKLFARYLTHGKVKGTTTYNRLAWLGSLPLQRLGKDAKTVFATLVGMGFGATIPIDNRQAILPRDEDNTLSTKRGKGGRIPL